MTDDELQERLRRLAARPDADWDAMAAAVRDGYARASASASASSASAITRRRRRWAASAGGVLAVAAALTLWLHGHRRALPAAAEPPETFHVFEDLEPGEMLEELTPEQIDRMAKAFNKGA